MSGNTLSLTDALPFSHRARGPGAVCRTEPACAPQRHPGPARTGRSLVGTALRSGRRRSDQHRAERRPGHGHRRAGRARSAGPTTRRRPALQGRCTDDRCRREQRLSPGGKMTIAENPADLLGGGVPAAEREERLEAGAATLTGRTGAPSLLPNERFLVGVPGALTTAGLVATIMGGLGAAPSHRVVQPTQYLPPGVPLCR